jgi:hypothetical protein
LDVVCPQAAINNQNRPRSPLTLADPQHFDFFPRRRSRAFRQPIYYPAIEGHVLAPISALAIVTPRSFSAAKADDR